MKMAHARIPHYGKSPPPRVVTSCVPTCDEKLITVKPLSRGQRWGHENVSLLGSCPPCRGWFPAQNLRKVGENETFAFFRVWISKIYPVIEQKENIHLLRILNYCNFRNRYFSYVRFTKVKKFVRYVKDLSI